MKNFIKIISAILIVAVAVIAIDCTTSTKTEGATDSTSVVVDSVSTVDTTNVDGGAGLDSASAPKK